MARVAQLDEVFAGVRAPDAGIGVVLNAQRDLVRVPFAESRPQRQVVAEVERRREAAITALEARRDHVEADADLDEPTEPTLRECVAHDRRDPDLRHLSMVITASREPTTQRSFAVEI